MAEPIEFCECLSSYRVHLCFTFCHLNDALINVLLLLLFTELNDIN